MIKGKTKSGFKFEFDENRMNDMRFVDALARMDKNDPIGFSEALNIVFDEDQKSAFYDFLKDENGRVPVDKCSELFGEIMEAAGDSAKNSESSQK